MYYSIVLVILTGAGIYFRRPGCWIILVLAGLCIPLGVFMEMVADGIGNASPVVTATKLALPYVIVISNFCPPRWAGDIWFWAIALQFIIYGIGACFAYRTEKKWKNLAIYIAVVAVIHALASSYANHLVPGNG